MYFTSRPASPARAFRFSTQNDDVSAYPKSGKNTDAWSNGPSRTRKSSTLSDAKISSKGKERQVTFDSLDSSSFAESFTVVDDTTAYSHRIHTHTHSTTPTRPVTADAASPRMKRGSILGAASDALRFGRRRKSLRIPIPPPLPVPNLLLPEVIELTATPNRDEDEEERQRLRDAAAQSIGLGIGLDSLDPPRSREESIYEDDEEDTPREDSRTHADALTIESFHTDIRPTPPVPASVPANPFAHRRRAGSLALSLTQSLAAAATPVSRIPAFPATHALLTPFMQLTAALPKHYPPPSLLMLALSKQWKMRVVMLTSPAAPAGPAVSYLHLFKSSAPEERELERLEINENSVVHVTDEEFGSRRNVIKVGGVDVGCMKKELNSEENGLTTMLLQVVDSAESQKWINAIKTAVLGQRSVRAGLGLPLLNMGGTEPRGDMDVMLSMRMQGILPSPTQSTFTSPELVPSPTSYTDESSSAPPTQPSTLRLHRPSSPRSPNAVLSLKGLFSGSSMRPRSPSRSASPNHDPDMSSESFSSIGSSLLNMRQSQTLPLDTSPLVKPFSMLPPSGPSLDQPAPQPLLQRKIVQNRTSLDWAPTSGNRNSDQVDAVMRELPARALSPSSLQPPPHRKRAWTTLAPPSSPEPGKLIYNHGNASTAGSFGIALAGDVISGHPSLERTGSSGGTPMQKPRASSVSSVSTLGSGSADRENSGLDRTNSGRRWSRQGIVPQRLTPPAGAPPPVPLAHSWQSNTSSSPPLSSSSHRLSHPYSAAEKPADRPPSRSSSLSQKTLPSIVSGLQMSSKRASVSSSVYSVASNNSSPPHANPLAHTRAINNNRLSIPPPQRPAPSSALPPTPPTPTDLPPQPASAPAMKTSFRDSLAHRAMRLSMLPPTSPPSQVLPPRPDEPAFRTHTRSSSIDSHPRSDTSHSIPSTLSDSPFPPPSGPLPAPPSSPTIPSSPRTSFKQRLRILSAPSPSPAPPRFPNLDVQFAAARAYTPPTTPIAERITLIQNDPDFLLLASTPIAPIAPVSPPRSPCRLSSPEHSPGGAPEMTSLSPPPRRGSRQAATPDHEKTRAEAALALPADATSELIGEAERGPTIDFSRNASTLSLGIVNDARALEALAA